MSTSPRIWFISGANTGLGLELALKAVKEGDKVIAAVRTPSKVPESLKSSPNVATLPFDLSWSVEKTQEAIKAAYAVHGRIDVLANNAAYAYVGAIEESTDEDTQRQFDINVFGVLRTIRAALPYLRAQKSGTIVNFSSIGALVAYPSNGIYCATKFAIEGISVALAAELEPFGIRVLAVEPGYTRTSFLKDIVGGQNIAKPIAAYDGTPAREATSAFDSYNNHQLGNPTLVAERIYESVTFTGLFKGKKVHLRLPLGSDTGTQLLKTAAEFKSTAEDYEDIWRSTDYKD